MITVQSIDNLQTVCPETKILALNTNGDSVRLQIELPNEVKEYFKTFLDKASDHTGVASCTVEFHRGVSGNGLVSASIPIEAERFTISDKSLMGEIPTREYERHDSYGSKRISNVRVDRYRG